MRLILGWDFPSLYKLENKNSNKNERERSLRDWLKIFRPYIMRQILQNSRPNGFCEVVILCVFFLFTHFPKSLATVLKNVRFSHTPVGSNIYDSFKKNGYERNSVKGNVVERG